MRQETYMENAISEILNPTFEITRQYLEVSEVEFENGKPKIERIDYDFSDDIVAVYFPIKDERFFLVVNLCKENQDIDFVFIQSANRVYLTATSETLLYEELKLMLQKAQTNGWSLGDLRGNRGSKFPFSRISYEPTLSEAYDLEQKLAILLTELEKDKESIKLLTEKADSHISVCRYQYVNGNAGISFDANTIKRLSDLNLGIDIDTYIVGKQLKS